ncbi:sensor histidine kinase [Nocardia sp. NPDC055029]
MTTTTKVLNRRAGDFSYLAALRDRIRRPGSVRTRVLSLVLIPSLALMFTAGAFAAMLAKQGVDAKRWSDALSTYVNLTLEFVVAVQAERSDSQRVVAGDKQAAVDLLGRRTATDAILRKAAPAGPRLQELNPEIMAKALPEFQASVSTLPTIRQSVDRRQAQISEIDEVYSDVVEMLVTIMNNLARASRDPETVAVEMLAADLLLTADQYSRAVGLAGGMIVVEGDPTFPERMKYLQLSGGFRNQLESLVPQLSATDRREYDRLTESSEWRMALAADESLGEFGELHVPLADWVAVHDRIAHTLHGLWSRNYSAALAASAASAGGQIARSSVVGIAMLAVVVATLFTSMRIAATLVRRLRSLRDKTIELAEQTLPEMMQRLHEGQSVDVDSELVRADEGRDELGQVAGALYTAHSAALAAAAAEAKARTGFSKVFLDIARRSQVLVHQQLAVLDAAESKQDNPEHLEMLFQLDHLATRARRNAENLLILGGGQAGRKWRQPVSLEEIARSAISETRDFTRVTAVRMPDVRVVGTAVADLIHLLAELVDNATFFSPPGAPVTVRGNIIGKGVVVEVEDQGLGIRPEERDRLNALLASPPDFQEMATSRHRHLGLFVVGQLAVRHHIGVNLLESAYGGIKAITILPTALLDGGTDMLTTMPTGSWSDQPRATDAVMMRANGEPAFPHHAEDVERTGLRSEQPASSDTEQHGVAVFLTSKRDTAQEGWGSRVPLPKRQRQAHLVPQLQVEQSTVVHESQKPRQRNADNARNVMSALQTGTREGRVFAVKNLNGNGWSGNE